jgi:hypothetical protein
VETSAAPAGEANATASAQPAHADALIIRP